MKNREDAEEVTQDVLMKVYRKTAMSRLRSRAVRAQAKTIRASGGRSRRRTDRSRSTGRSCRTRPSCAQLRRAIAAAIEELPEIYRAPLVLRDIQGLSTGEARARLKLKDQTLKARLHRGRLMLRERLRAFAGGLALHRPTPACC